MTRFAKITALACALLTSGAPVLHAGVAPDPVLSGPGTASDTVAVNAVRALFNRCFPVMSGQPAMALGMVPAEAALAKHLLGHRPGQAWQSRQRDLFVVAFDDTPLCKVIVLGVDDAVLGDLVLSVFREDETPFRQQRFRVGETGGFAAVYTADVAGTGVVVRVHTAKNGHGQSMATLSIERSGPIAD